MKKFTKPLALLLSALLVLSIVPMTAFATINPDKTVTFTDNFENPENSAQIWETEKLSGSEDVFPAKSIDFSVADGEFNPAYTASSSKFLGVTTIKDENWSSSAQIKSWSFDIDMQKLYGGWDIARPIAYFDSATGSAVGWEMAYNATYKRFTTRPYRAGGAAQYLTADGKNGSINGNVSGTNMNSTTTEVVTSITFHMDVTYSYYVVDEKNVIQFKYVLTGPKDGTGEAVVWQTRYYNAVVPTVKGFKSGFQTSTVGVSTCDWRYDNVSITYDANKTDAEMAEEFKTLHKTVLEMDSQDVTLETSGVIDAAMADYDSLPSTAKLLLTEEKTKLDDLSEAVKVFIKGAYYNKHKTVFDKELSKIKTTDKEAIFKAFDEYEAMSEFSKEVCAEYKTKLDSVLEVFYEKNYKFNGDDFEIDTYTNHYWKTKAVTDNTTPNTSFETVKNNDNTYLVPSSSATNKYVIDYPEIPAENRVIEESGGKFYIDKTHTWAAAKIVAVFDPTSNDSMGFEFAKNANGTSTVRGHQTGNVTAVAGSQTSFTIPEKTWINYKVTYTYAQNDDTSWNIHYYMTMFTVDAQGEQTKVGSMDWTKKISKNTDLTIGFIGPQNTEKAIFFDDVYIKYFPTEAEDGETADLFREKYESVLSKAYNQVVNGDTATINAALAEIETYSDSTKALLVFEKQVLNCQLKVIASEFNYDNFSLTSIKEIWKLLKTVNAGEKIYLANLIEEVKSLLNENASKVDARKTKIKIAVVGDSLTAGQGCSEGHDYPTVLGNMLGDGYTVKNFGVGGAKITTTFHGSDKHSEFEIFAPDVVIITLGLNDNLGNTTYYNDVRQKYLDLIAYFQGLDNCPSIILGTSTWTYARSVPNDDMVVCKMQKEVAKEYGFPILDMYALARDEIAATFAQFEASGDYANADEVLAANQAKWFSDVTLHYSDYGYSRMAQWMYDFIKYSYVDLRTPLHGITNFVCYGDKWDASYDAAVDALDTNVKAFAYNSIADDGALETLESAYNALNDVQKLRFKTAYEDSYKKLTMARSKANSLNFVNTAVNAFVSEYGEFLNKASLTSADLATYKNALLAYNQQSDVVKYELASYKAKMEALEETLTTALANDYLVKANVEAITNATETEYKALRKAWVTINCYNAEDALAAAGAKQAILAKINAYGPYTAENEKIKILCIGDSLTWGNYSNNHYQNSYPAVLQRLLGDSYDVLNAGVNGARIWSILEQSAGRDPKYWLQEAQTEIVEEYQPNIVIIMLGTNNSGSDVKSCSEGGTTYDTMKEYLDFYRSLDSAPTIIMATSPASTNKGSSLDQIRIMQKNIAEKEGLGFVDIGAVSAEWEPYSEETKNTTYFVSDNLHFNNAGYAAFAQEFANYILGAKEELTTERMHHVDFSSELFTAKYSSLTSGEVTMDTVDTYNEMLAVYDSMLPLSKAAVSTLKGQIDAYIEENYPQSEFEATYGEVLESATPAEEDVLSMCTAINKGEYELTAEEEAKVEEAITKAGIRPVSNGATLSTGAATKIGFACNKPDNSKNYTKFGVVISSYNSMVDNGITELTIGAKDSLSFTKEYNPNDEKGDELIFTIGGLYEQKENWNKWIVARFFCVYEDANGNEVTIYNDNASPNNPDGATEVDGTKGVIRSTNGIIKGISGILYSLKDNTTYNTIVGAGFIDENDTVVDTYKGIELANLYSTVTHKNGALQTAQDTLYMLKAYNDVFKAVTGK